MKQQPPGEELPWSAQNTLFQKFFFAMITSLLKERCKSLQTPTCLIWKGGEELVLPKLGPMPINIV